ncbi:helix-turn-helix domain-containing protein [Paenibacillus mesophilus]|uniref:helix-turn-helix domain-containing protein n=1 Tax=Paenibacillus mesophilus TaxID=2582849 RepID=UPI00110F1E07|nr:AraC family transcriptional regulator [Paenibacillus mesophilus]TMV51927.1 helix-turn-helix domain-containing protein [Paenibacillus mesophilus]
MNSKLYKEPIPYQDNMLSIKIIQQVKPFFSAPPGSKQHYHKEIEMLYVQEGCLEMGIQDEHHRLEPGDILLIGSSQPHITKGVASERTVYLTLHFDLQPYYDPSMLVHYRYFAEIDSPLSHVNEMFRQHAKLRNDIGRAVLDIHREMESRSRGYNMAVSLLVKQILLTILRSDSDEAARSYERLPVYPLHLVLEYVESHLKDKIEMETISKMMNLSYSYFSKYFKRVMGLSFIEYVNIRRIKQAERLLLTKDGSIAAIAEQVGITNIAHFYELFKRYNRCSPKEYAQKLASSCSPTND